MKRITIAILSRFITCALFMLIAACSITDDADFSERTKIALRDVGNQLLLSQKDSTSLILPILELEANRYQLAFNNALSFEPSTLVAIVEHSFNSLQLPKYYRVELQHCSDREVAYSYQMSEEEESTIIPCIGRFLPESCYIIQVKFVKITDDYTTTNIISLSIVILVLVGLGFLLFKKVNSKKTKQKNGVTEKLGSFYFYPEQNKLVKEAQEIALSKKECELLALFVANPNQIIKRDELTKRVWEDNGVFVGRSLDTYISKLRKKLQSDASIKLTNVHGVGYKLEIN